MNFRVTKSNKFITKAKSLQRKISAEIKKLDSHISEYPSSLVDFVKSVEVFVNSVMDQTNEKKFVTLKQIQALENMLSGLKQWTKSNRK